MNLTLTPRRMEPDVDIVELTGRITLGRDSGQLESTVTGLLAAGSHKIIIDLAGVTYVDSSGVGSIAFSANKATQAKAKLAVVGARGLVLEVFRITRIDLIVPFFPDVPSAVASFDS